MEEKMRKIKEIAKKAFACSMAMCLTTGLMTGIGMEKSVKTVKAASTGFTKNDFLKVDGTYVKNNYGKGNNVYLRGTNIGNLFVQESWMSSTSAADQKTILEGLTNQFGQDKALELLEYYESNYFTTDDLDNCKNMGMSVIRVPFTYMNLYKKSGNSWVLRSDAFTRLDWIVEQCSQRGIYVILDLHGAFGSQNGQDHSGEVIDSVEKVTFFSNDTLKNQTLDLWRTVAQHYAGNPAVAGYDTLNEPGEKAGSTGEKHWAFYDQMYDTIRSVDPDHIIIMESCWGTGNLPNPSKYGWTNVMYEYHHYPWDYVADTDANYTGQVNAINNLVSSVNSANYGVPTYIGEFNCFDGDAKWKYVLDKMNKAGWHYTNWSYKSNGMGSWGIYHEYANAGKVNPSSDSESSIRTKWGSSNIGTNNSERGITYNNMKPKLPGTVVFADTALTNDSYFGIQATINSKYVCSEDYGESNLIADRDSAGGWEQFRIIRNSDGTYSFQARANNKYLCAVIDDTDTENPVIARSNKISDWEKFSLEKQSNGTYAIKANANGKYVQADINDTKAGILHACADTVGTWETFNLNSVTGVATIPGAGNEQVTENQSEAQTQKEEVSVDIPKNTSSTKFGNDFKVVAYYPNWYGNYTSQVQWDKLTHAYYAFGLPDASGNGTMTSISGESSNIKAMINACNQHNVVPVLSVGGWSHSGASDGLCRTVFALNTNTEAKRQSLANSIVSQAKAQGFKGIDIDWEYPTSSTQSQYVDFMKKLRTLCNQNDMILTVAVAATSGAGFTSEVLNLLDFVNLMAYDGDNGSDGVGHSPYSFATESFNYWKNTMGVPANKLVIGVPFYEKPNWASYADIVAKNSAYAQTDSAVINGTTVYYNGIPTMKQKATYAANNAGGIMIWEISQDSTNSSLSLLNAIYDTILPIVGEGSITEATVTEVPGTVKVDSCASKSSGISYTTANGITYAGGLTTGSTMDYYIHVAEAGKYNITLNLAAGNAQWNTSAMIVTLNDGTTVNVPVQASTGWETFIPHIAEINFAAKGTYKLTITSKDGACNVTDFSITKKNEETSASATTAAPQTTKEVTSQEATTKKEETSAVNAGWVQIYDDGGQPTQYYYESGSLATVVNIQSPGFTPERGIYANVPAGISGVTVNGATLNSQNIQGAGLIIPLTVLNHGENAVVITYAGGTTTLKVKSEVGETETTKEVTSEETTKEVTTKEVTTKEETTEKESVQVEINGCQMNVKKEGYRVVYSVTESDDVVKKGLVYGLADYATDADMVVGSNAKTVYDYEANAYGKLSKHYGKLNNSSSYAMTMKLLKKVPFYTSTIKVRAYAQLKDGSYVYSNISQFSIYSISNTLYQNLMMDSEAEHNYLYNTILKAVNPAYEQIDYA
jgi:aryl-phospho-beta-D-glucosidase BglC (GH1 family)/GH18 family chitinase